MRVSGGRESYVISLHAIPPTHPPIKFDPCAALQLVALYLQIKFGTHAFPFQRTIILNLNRSPHQTGFCLA